MTVLRLDPEVPQRQAADPAASVWVAASAGTGKTKVLTDRVLNLLLAGGAPERILCLTFTKAAAAEMANRIAARLAQWATQDDAALDAELGKLTGREIDDGLRATARRLFARVLDVPGGMKIQTIHAFCQSLLRRFPLEAGLAPHFQVMDDRDSAELLRMARDEVLERARQKPSPPMGEGSGEGGAADSNFDSRSAPLTPALSHRGRGGELGAALAEVALYAGETGFPELMDALAAERGRLRRMILREGGAAGAVAALRGRLGLDADETPDVVMARACEDSAFEAAACRAAAEILRRGSGTDAARAEGIARWLAADAGARAAGFDDYCRQYLTSAGEVRARLATKACQEALPALQAEAERLLRVTERWRAAKVAQATTSLLRLAEALLGAYDRHKDGRALLDYDDLILRAVGLLQAPGGAAAWVLYKLDGGLDHVLIDEAQDTNPDQWAVVRALTDEFFAGWGAREGRVRTVFAVGDAKQSIYSFQRADPREFERMRLSLSEQVPAANQRWTQVGLHVSFRSTKAVLDAVDAVFNMDPGRDGVALDGEDIRHWPWRDQDAGLVELWPPVRPAPQDEPPPWKPPVERVKGDSPRTRLARLVAKRIRAMVGRETLESKGRPIRAGDVMVLVRRRNAFVEDLVRELKALGVEVAGADRLVLGEQMAVMDLVALGRVLMLPEDDLSLATVLKGPLFGLDEEALFRLARGRPGTLWQALKSAREFAGEADRLADLLALADRVPPHELFAHVLGPLGGRLALVRRLGWEAEDAIDEFMGLTLAYERAHAPSLQGFLHWLEAGAVEVKRDLEQASHDAVRIMTVHGSKGLQAPVVFLPDTLQAPSQTPRLLWLGGRDDEVLAWVPKAELADPVCRAAREAAQGARDQEYRRLLYVAMTRAEDRLYVCGWETRRAAPEHCWYNLIAAALRAYGAPAEEPALAGETDSAEVWRIASPQTRAVAPAQAAVPAAGDAAWPDWIGRMAPAEPSPPRPLAPSAPDGEEPPVRAPLGPDRGVRFQRGLLVHRLLQTLPELPPDRRAKAAARFLARRAFGLPVAAQAELAAEVARVLDDPAFAPIFGPGSQAEVPVVGLIGERVVSGQVDRLLVTEAAVLVVDYKTNRPAPATPAAVPAVYLRQMAAYRAALACVYPGREVRCALLWTDGPRLMPLDPALLDDALAGLGRGSGGASLGEGGRLDGSRRPP